MSLLTKFADFFSKNKSIKGLLPTGGKSSEDVSGVQGLFNHENVVNPYMPSSIINLLQEIAVNNPDVSQALKNYMRLGNVGHSVVILDKNTRAVEAAHERLNQKVRSWFPGGGVDQIIDDFLHQLCVPGAISRENVIQRDLRGVERLVIVPCSSIRFLSESGEYKPYQKLRTGELRKLNELTYQYYPGSTMENSPYAIPPFTPVLLPLTRQHRMLKSIDHLLEKSSLLGFLDVEVEDLRPEPGDNPQQIRSKNQKYLEKVADALDKGFTKGLLVRNKGMKVDFNSVMAKIAGVKEIFQLNEEQIFSALAMDAALCGRSYSSTETYSGVVYELLIKSVSSMQRLIKRALEETYRLDFLLAEINVERVALLWNKNKGLKPNLEALARNYNVNTTLKLVDKGAIDPDEGANELGYEKWFNKARIGEGTEPQKLKGGAFRYDSSLMRYVQERPFITSLKDDDKKREDRAKDAEKQLAKHTTTYLKKTLPYFDELKGDVIDFATQYVKDNIEAISQDPSGLLTAVKEYVNDHSTYKDIKNKDSWFRKTTEAITVEAGKEYKEKDLTAFSGNDPDANLSFGTGDLDAMKFHAGLDTFYFSKFVDNEGFGSKVDTYIKQFLERGEATAGQWTEAAEKEFKRLFGDALDDDFGLQMERIINSSIGRIRVYSHLSQLNDAGFQYAVINGILDGSTCAVCGEMHGKKIPIGKAWDVISEFVGLEDVEAAAEFIKKSNITSVDDAKKDMATLLSEGRGICPFHVLCRCILEGVLNA